VRRKISNLLKKLDNDKASEQNTEVIQPSGNLSTHVNVTDTQAHESTTMQKNTNIQETQNLELENVTNQQATVQLQQYKVVKPRLTGFWESFESFVHKNVT
jgi:hypothetical protein